MSIEKSGDLTGNQPVTFYDSCINVLSLLLTTTGHILVYSAQKMLYEICHIYICTYIYIYQIPATGNPVLSSKGRAGVSCTEKEGH
jgi:hypothetical protein